MATNQPADKNTEVAPQETETAPQQETTPVATTAQGGGGQVYFFPDLQKSVVATSHEEAIALINKEEK